MMLNDFLSYIFLEGIYYIIKMNIIRGAWMWRTLGADEQPAA